MNSDILIAYFSRPGENYVKGKVERLSVGNTQIVAEKAASLTGGRLFRIEPENPYSPLYAQCVKQARADMQSNARPALKTDLPEAGAYDALILCYPNYCGAMPMPVWTFLEAHSFSGARILPVCTHEGSGMGRSEEDLAKLCPHAQILAGLAVRGCEAQASDEAIERRLKEAGFI